MSLSWKSTIYHSLGHHCLSQRRRPYQPVNVAYRIGIRGVDGDPETWFSVNFQTIVAQMRLPPGLCHGPRCMGGLQCPHTPSLKRLGHTTRLTTLLKNRSRATVCAPHNIMRLCACIVRVYPSKRIHVAACGPIGTTFGTLMQIHLERVVT